MALSQALREVVESVVEGWYPPGTPMLADELLDRVEQMSGKDLGNNLLSERNVAIVNYARRLRRQARDG